MSFIGNMKGRGTEVRTVLLKTFWVSWYETADDPAPEVWPLPDGVAWYITGCTADMEASTLCVLLSAPDEESAKKMIRRWWGHGRRKIEWRFCLEKPHGWTPGEDRFPEAAR